MKSYHAHASLLKDAQRRFNIYDIWEHFRLPGNSRKNPTFAPYRNNHRTPALSIWNKGQSFHDKGIDVGGDATRFLSLVLGVDNATAAREHIRLAGIERAARPLELSAPGQSPGPVDARNCVASHLVEMRSADQPSERAESALTIKVFAESAERSFFQKASLCRGPRAAPLLSRLAAARNVHVEALEELVRRKLLYFGELPDGGERVPVWIIADGEGRNAQARRMDGKVFSNGGKAKTLKGSTAAWPIGAAHLADFPIAALCEGGPDFLTTASFAWSENCLEKVAPVCMAGASLSIHEDALPRFRDKTVFVFPHNDADGTGQRAAERWVKQLISIAKKVVAFCFDGLIQSGGAPVKDLNDLTKQDVDCWENDYDSRTLFQLPIPQNS